VASSITTILLPRTNARARQTEMKREERRTGWDKEGKKERIKKE
jgi:hypothetical protein